MNRRTFAKGIGAALLALNLHLVPALPGKPPELLWFEHHIKESLESMANAGLIYPNWKIDGETVDMTLRGVIQHITIEGNVSV